MSPVPNQGWRHARRVPRPGQGQTVLDYLSSTHRHASRAVWQTRLEAGEVHLGDHVAAPDEILKAGQVLARQRPPWVEPDVPCAFAVLYLDPDLLAVAKPRGLPTLPGGGEFLENTLLRRVQRHFPGAVCVHRLGRGTSGLVLLARSAWARARLAEDFRTHCITKTYRALVQGHWKDPSGELRTPIGPVPHALLGEVFAATASGGRPSITRFRRLETRGDQTLVEFQPLTGRPHQIRIHAAAAGHPLVGDPLYPVGGVPHPHSCSRPGDLGYLLHAERLEGMHPRSGQPLRFHCSPPRALRGSDSTVSSAARPGSRADPG